MIELVNLSFSYEQAHTLKDIHLCIKNGEFIALTGGNGSGKSTLLKLIEGIERPTSGKVIVFGMDTRDEESLLEIRKKIGFVFQNPENQIIASTVEEDIVFGMENLGFSRELMKKKLNEILDFTGLKGMEKKSPMTLSGGQKQRLAIASALVSDPRILLLDEPMAMLDPEGKREVLRLIIDCHKNGKTVLIATHDMDMASFTQRLIFLKAGKIELEGNTDEMLPRLSDYEEIEL